MNYEIKNRYYEKVIYQAEAESFKALVEAAIKSSADLRSANLSSADLRSANLSSAYLSSAYLRSADLRSANLSSANLSSANLYGAGLSGAKNISDRLNNESSILPDSGPFVGWKKCKGGVVVRFAIPSKSKRSNATGRKCRAEYVKVLEVIGAEKGISEYDGKTTYEVGKVVCCDTWNPDRWVECGGGIHFFITRWEAENYG